MDNLKKNISKGIQGIQGFTSNNKRNKKFKNIRKLNHLFINTKNLREGEKNYKSNSFKKNNIESKSNDDPLIDKAFKLFATEIEYRNNFMNFRNNYSINIGGGRTTKEKYNIKNYYISPRKKYNKQIFNNIMDMCHDLYQSKNSDNNLRMKLREDILNNVNNYVFSNLKRNILFQKIVETKKKKYKLIIPNIKRKKKVKSMDFNKIYLNKIIKKDYEKSDNSRNSRIITYENYAKKDTNYNHPQIYTLNNNFYKDRKLITIGTQANLKPFLDFSKLIPERKIDQKEINKQIYSVYKTMKDRNEIAFHI